MFSTPHAIGDLLEPPDPRKEAEAWHTGDVRDLRLVKRLKQSQITEPYFTLECLSLLTFNERHFPAEPKGFEF